MEGDKNAENSEVFGIGLHVKDLPIQITKTLRLKNFNPYTVSPGL